MRILHYTLFLLLNSLAQVLSAQSFDITQANPLAYARGAAELVVLQNPDNRLPLSEVAPGQVAAFAGMGREEAAAFSQYLALYTAIGLSGDAASGKSTLVMGLSSRWLSVPENAGRFREVLAQAQKNKAPLVIAMAGGWPAGVELPQRAALIWSPFDDALHWSLLAQAIMGGLSANGQLVKDLGPFFKSGAGLAISANRLGYAPPEAVDLNRQILWDSIRTILSQGLQAGAYPGAQLLMAKGGKVVVNQAFGYHTFDQTRAVTTSDQFDLASVTKVSAGTAALLRLHSDGKLNLDAPLKDYFPLMRKGDKANLSFREILSHQSGLKPGIVFWAKTVENGRFKPRTFQAMPSKKYSVRVSDQMYLHRSFRKKIWKGIRDLELNPVKEFKYSDMGFMMTTEVVERLTQKPLDQFLYESFYRPLGAVTTGYQPWQKWPPAQIVPTEQDTFFRHLLVQGNVHDENTALMGGVSGHAGLFSNANDLAKVWQMYLNKGQYGGHSYFNAASFDIFNQRYFVKEGNHRGLGFDKPVLPPSGASYYGPSASDESFGHSGFTGTFVWADPANNSLIILLTNRVNPTRDNRQLYSMNIRPRLHEVIYSASKK